MVALYYEDTWDEKIPCGKIIIGYVNTEIILNVPPKLNQCMFINIIGVIDIWEIII